MRHRILLATVGLAVAVFAVAVHAPLAALAGGGLAVFGMAIPNEPFADVIRQLAAWRVLDPMGGPIRRVIAKTANYVVLDPYTTTGGDPSGTIFTNRAATGTVVFTLPAPTRALAGVFYDFLGIADFTITVQTATADTLIAANDIAADSLSAQTAGQLIGAMIRVLCDGTSWVAMGLTPGKGADTTTTTYTVAT